jgi:hypothetical protein
MPVRGRLCNEVELFAGIAIEVAIRYKVKMADSGTPCSPVQKNNRNIQNDERLWT